MITKRDSGALVAVVMAVALMVFVVPYASATTTLAPPSTSLPTQQWAYGAVRNIAVSGSAPNGTYSIAAYFGWAVIFTQTNTSSTSFSVEAQRTTGATFYENYCQPTCGSPLAAANLSYHGWETAAAFANFTTAGNVMVGTHTVPALALENASSMVLGNVTESEVVTLHGAMGTRMAFKDLAVRVASNVSINFVPPLGLFPDNLGNITSWSSQAQYNAFGSWSGAYAYSERSFNGNFVSGGGAPSGTLTGAGNLTVNGSNAGNYVLNNGRATSQLALRFTGLSWNFDDREGFILVPSAVDLFGQGSHNWNMVTTGSSTASTAYVNYASSRAGHLGLIASSTLYSSASPPPATAVQSPGITPSVTTGSVPVQGEPMTVANAQHTSQCLILGGCPSPISKGPIGTVLVGLGVLAVAVLVAALVVASRRRTPPPVFPNANLYPPGAAIGPSTKPAAPGSTSTARRVPEEESSPDPLENLW